MSDEVKSQGRGYTLTALIGDAETWCLLAFRQMVFSSRVTFKEELYQIHGAHKECREFGSSSFMWVAF